MQIPQVWGVDTAGLRQRRCWKTNRDARPMFCRVAKDTKEYASAGLFFGQGNVHYRPILIGADNG